MTEENLKDLAGLVSLMRKHGYCSPDGDFTRDGNVPVRSRRGTGFCRFIDALNFRIDTDSPNEVYRLLRESWERRDAPIDFWLCIQDPSEVRSPDFRWYSIRNRQENIRPKILYTLKYFDLSREFHSLNLNTLCFPTWDEINDMDIL
jgi:hypothetical protein